MLFHEILHKHNICVEAKCNKMIRITLRKLMSVIPMNLAAADGFSKEMNKNDLRKHVSELHI